MSVYALAAGGIIAGAGVVVEGITCAITGIRATKEDDSAQKSQLLAASATVGFGTILLIISLILLFIYQIKGKVAGSSKGLGIASLVIGIVAMLLLITGATIAGVFSQRYKSDLTTANSFKAAAILTAIGFVLILIGYIVLYITVSKRLKFKR